MVTHTEAMPAGGQCTETAWPDLTHYVWHLYLLLTALDGMPDHARHQMQALALHIFVPDALCILVKAPSGTL